MANQVYNLTQTGAQVQSIINDANKVMGAGSQSTLTTDSILLKDTSGNYHKIDKSSFTEAVRNTMASLLVNNDKGTTISQVAAIASGDFGSITPDNLAQVLGVPRFILAPEIAVNSDADNLTDFPCYRSPSGAVTASTSHLPSNITTTLGFVLLNFQPYTNNPVWSTQVIIQLSKIWVRNRNSEEFPPLFPEWKQVQLNAIQ